MGNHQILSGGSLTSLGTSDLPFETTTTWPFELPNQHRVCSNYYLSVCWIYRLPLCSNCSTFELSFVGTFELSFVGMFVLSPFRSFRNRFSENYLPQYVGSLLSILLVEIFKSAWPFIEFRSKKPPKLYLIYRLCSVYFFIFMMSEFF